MSTKAPISRTLPTSLERYPGFRSPKTGGIGIRYPRRWSLGGLLMANFDPSVSTMRAVDTEGLSCSGLISFAFRVVAGENSWVMVLVEDNTVLGPEALSELGAHVVLRRAEITKEPVATSLRIVWSNKDTKVTAGKRIKILTTVASARGGIRLDELTAAFPTGPDDGMSDILRLVCDDDLSIDLKQGIVPEAMVRRVIHDRNASIAHVAFEPATPR